MRISIILSALLLIACGNQNNNDAINKKTNTVIDGQIKAYKKAQSVEQVLLDNEHSKQEQLQQSLQ